MSTKSASISAIEDGLPATESLIPIIEQALSAARLSGASAAEANLGVSRALNVSVRRGDVETLEFQEDRDLGLTVYFGQRRGHATTGDFSPTAITETVQAACAIARFAGEDVWSGLAPADRMATHFPALDLYHPWDLTPEVAIALAQTCEQAGFDADSRINNSEGASVSTSMNVGVYGNSHGFIGSGRGTRHDLGCVLIAGQGASMQRDYWFSSARLREELDAAAQIGREAARRACARLNPQPIATGEYPILFVPEMARSLFGSYLGAISGGALYRKASFLLDSLGQAVFSPIVQLSQRPHLPRAAASSAFDGEGVATIDRDLVLDGVVQGYLLDSYAARRLKMESTGNAGGVFNLLVEPGEQDFSGLVRMLDRGLVVTELMGSGVNAMTGDYSRGAAGFWVERGEIVHPVEAVTIAGNLRDMFRDMVALGNDIDTRRSVRCPSVLLQRMTVAANQPT